ncbi:hypothetical protein CYMTET_28900 [Cymbomonas tetramitiformis]|uniref:Uncharacterized protein n=1 Tax=Cymbomonas tetramitiformis TaxID=36881 RepID=A0AAE0KVG1_9CHLO|nr:hypothetical protein CYMTET_28900 [Cymbomonas tetramitiformis]
MLAALGLRQMQLSDTSARGRGDRLGAEEPDGMSWRALRGLSEASVPHGPTVRLERIQNDYDSDSEEADDSSSDDALPPVIAEETEVGVTIEDNDDDDDDDLSDKYFVAILALCVGIALLIFLFIVCLYDQIFGTALPEAQIKPLVAKAGAAAVANPLAPSHPDAAKMDVVVAPAGPSVKQAEGKSHAMVGGAVALTATTQVGSDINGGKADKTVPPRSIPMSDMRKSPATSPDRNIEDLNLPVVPAMQPQISLAADSFKNSSRAAAAPPQQNFYSMTAPAPAPSRIEHDSESDDEELVPAVPLQAASRGFTPVRGKNELSQNAPSPQEAKRFAAKMDQAARTGSLDEIEKLLVEGADKNGNGQGQMSPLHQAALNGQVEAVRLLVRKGADVNQLSDGASPLTLAASRGHMQVCQVFLQECRNVEHLEQAQEAAKQGGYSDVVKLLKSESQRKHQFRSLSYAL